jgi:hypothetical protein
MSTDARRRPALPGRRPAVPGAAAVLAAALLLAGCAGTSGDEDAPPSPSTSPSRTAAPSPAPSPSASAPAEGTDDGTTDAAAPDWATPSTDGEPSADARLTVTDIRVGAHEGFDRVVVDLAGTGTPGWHAQVDPQAVVDPTGEVLDLGGEAALTVYLTGMGYPFETGATELAAGTVTPGVTVVTGVGFDGTFEGQSPVYVGLSAADAPFRVFVLTDPTRLVVDVQRSMA